MPPPARPGTQSVRPNASPPPPVPKILMPDLCFPAGWWDDGGPPTGADARHFPGRNEQTFRGHPNFSLASLAFRSALRTARELRIIDAKFDGRDGAGPLGIALRDSAVLEVFILTGSCRDVEMLRRRLSTTLVKNLRAQVQVAPVVEWRTHLERSNVCDVHDRFAIVDGELWHFGATVGGAHRSINAYSRGWDAAKARAREFFDEVWTHA